MKIAGHLIAMAYCDILGCTLRIAMCLTLIHLMSLLPSSIACALAMRGSNTAYKSNPAVLWYVDREDRELSQLHIHKPVYLFVLSVSVRIVCCRGSLLCYEECFRDLISF